MFWNKRYIVQVNKLLLKFAQTREQTWGTTELE